MAGTNVQGTINLTANLDISKIKSSINQIKSSLAGIKMSPNLQASFTKAFSGLEKSLDQYEARLKKGFSSKSDVSGLNKNINEIIKYFSLVDKEIDKIRSELGNEVDLGKFIKIPEDAKGKIQGLKKEIEGLKKNLDALTGKDSQAFKGIAEAIQKIKNAGGQTKTAEGALAVIRDGDLAKIDTYISKIEKLKGKYAEGSDKHTAYSEIAKILNQVKSDGGRAFSDLDAKSRQLQQTITETFNRLKSGVITDQQAMHQLGQVFEESSSRMRGLSAEQQRYNQELDMMKNRIQYFFGINNAINLLKRSVKDAIETVKDLDAAMTQTAVVTDFSVGDMWEQLPRYTQAANELGTTTLGAYETMTLFYQQGLNTQQAFAIGTETMKMARIANMDYAEATDMMTAALRGFNMELNEASAQRVNDVYSKLAAITAADTNEIATAMTKTASIAASANMEFETTAALLSQIIETTREAPETAGTAMKTIIARFTEVKKVFSEGKTSGKDSEGEAFNINKIDEALKTVGMSLQGFLRGEEGIDDIFLQLAEKWDTLDLATQRYIATMAAGSRQQSRFLAMMSDYDRTMELVSAANDSAGASQTQFEKTIDSLESKLNKLKNAWDQFVMGITNSTLVKGGVDVLTQILNTANQITEVFGNGLLSSIMKVGLALNALKLGKLAIGGISAATPKVLGTSGGRVASKILGLDQFFGKIGQNTEQTEAATGFKAIVIQAAQAFKGIVTGSAVGAAGATGAIATGSVFGRFIQKLTGQEKNAQKYNELNSPAARMRLGYGGETGKYMTQKGLYTGTLGTLGMWASGKGFGEKTYIGKKLSESGLAKSIASALGTSGATGAGTAAGALASFAATLGLISVAAVGAGVAIHKTYDALKINTEEAQEAAERSSKAAEDARRKEEKFNSELENYKQKRYNLENVMPGSKEWEQALIESNDAVISFANQFPSLTYELDTATGALMLTSESLGGLNKELKEQANLSRMTEMLSSNYALRKQQQDLETDNYILEHIKKPAAYDINDISGYTLEQESNKNAMRNLQLQMESQFAQAIRGLDLGEEEIPLDFVSAMAKNYQEQFDSAFEQSFKNLFGLRTQELMAGLLDKTSYTEEELLSLYGNGKKLDKERAKEALALINASEQISSSIQELPAILETLAQNIDRAIGDEILDAYNQVMAGDNRAQLHQIGKGKPIDWASYSSALGYANVQDAQNAYAQNLYSILQYQQTKMSDVHRLMERTGQQDVFNELGKEYQLSLGYLLDDLNNAFTGKGIDIFKSLFKGEKDVGKFKEYADTYLEAFNNIDFSNPIQAAQQLNSYLESGNANLQHFAKTLQGAADNSILNVANQFQYLYDNIFSVDENIEDLADSMEELDADDIRELCDEFEDLGTFIDEAGLSAGTFASLLHAVVAEGLGIHLITDELLAALGTFNSFSDHVLEVLDEIKNYEFGPDLGEIADTITGQGKTMLDQINAGEFGNLEAISTWDFMFGEGNWKAEIDNIDTFKAKALELYDVINASDERGDLQPFWESSLTKLPKRQITFEDGGKSGTATWNAETQQVDWELPEGMDYEAIVDSIEDQLGYTELMAEALLADAANNDMQLRSILDEHSVDDAMAAYMEKADKGAILDQAQMNLIAGQTADPNAARARIEEIARANGLVIDQWTNSTLSEGINYGLGGTVPSDFTEHGYEDRIADAFIKNGQAAPPNYAAAQEAVKKHFEDIQYKVDQGQAAPYDFGDNLKGAETYDEAWQNFLKQAETSKDPEALAAEYGASIQNAYAKYQAALNSGTAELENTFTADLDTLRQYASDGAIFDELGRTYQEGFSNLSQITSQELTALGKDALDIDWDAVNSNFGGDLEAWYNNQLKNIEVESTAKTFAEAFTQSLADAGLEGTELTFQAQIENPETMTTAIETALNEVNASGLQATVESGLATAGENGASSITTSISDLQGSATISVTYQELNSPSQGNVATGGFVSSFSHSFAAGSGNNQVQPGKALTGEEGAEIVWNKERGYAYIAGSNGPEYNNLKPGDRIFNASETRQIFRNSKRGSRPALASGGLITPAYANTSSYGNEGWFNSSGGSSGRSSGDGRSKSEKEKTPNEWKNDFDWLYNLVEDIAELEREQTNLQKVYELYLEDIAKNGHELAEITREQLQNLYEQYNKQEFMLRKRQQEMNEYLIRNEKYGAYGTYNKDDNTVEINWDAIEAIQDEELYKKVEEYVDGLEDIQDKMDEAEEALLDIEKDIKEMQTRFEEAYIDGQDRIAEAIVSLRESEIENLSNINDTISDTNGRLLDAVNKTLQEQRQARENTKTEEEIAEKERRLSFLRQDTSGLNQTEILQLEEELSNLKEDYTDTLIDQKLSELQDQEDFAAEQRERQIGLLQSQLDYEQRTGALWEEVNTLIKEAMGGGGELLMNSNLVDILKTADSETWSGLSAAQKDLWEKELINEFKEVFAYLELGASIGSEDYGKTVTFINGLGEMVEAIVDITGVAVDKNGLGYNGIYWNDKKQQWITNDAGYKYEPPENTIVPRYSQPTIKNETGGDINQTMSSGVCAGCTGQCKSDCTFTCRGFCKDSCKSACGNECKYSCGTQATKDAYKAQGYATGGLADYTGPAWLDGTKSKPELVLNARDTANFIELKDILSSLLTNKSHNSNDAKGGDNYFNITVQAQIENDYDVEKLAKKIKEEIYKDGSYRNVNVIRNIR